MQSVVSKATRLHLTDRAVDENWRLAWQFAGKLAVLVSIYVVASRPLSGQENAATAPGKRVILLSSVKPTDTVSVTFYGLTRNDFWLIENLPGVSLAIPVRYFSTNALYGDRNSPVRLVGTSDKLNQVVPVSIARGIFLIEKDNDKLNNVAVLGAAAAERIFPFQDPIGKNIRIDTQYFLVVGIAKPREKKEEEFDVYIPWHTMRSRYGDRLVSIKSGIFETDYCELSEIRLTVKDPTNIIHVLNTIRRLLAENHENKDYKFGILK